MSKDNDDSKMPMSNEKTENNKNCGKQNGSRENANKKAKTNTFEDILDPSVRTEEREQRLKEEYWNATPYRHARIEKVFQPDFLTACKEQIKQHSKVNFKETDLFRVYQSIDLANLEPNSDLAKQMPAVMQLRQVLYSQEWRSYMERLTKLQPGTLSNQVDCACNCHAPGCHLLCHDDVIGTRKISYILYLTEPDWKEEEGGALELYDSFIKDSSLAANNNAKKPGNGNNVTQNDDKSKEAARREPETCPSKLLKPLFNSMAFFVVEPGVSFHAVQEVLGERPRLSIQGWYHAATAPEHAENATLNRLKEVSSQANGNKDDKNSINNTVNDIDEEPFIELKDERVQPLELQRKQRAANADKLLDSDRDYLAQYVNETYLTKAAMEEIRQRFEEDSSVQLRNFFRKTWVVPIQQILKGHDKESRPQVGHEGYYTWGESDEWKLVGPPHKQRYLQYQEKPSEDGNQNMMRNFIKDPLASALPPNTESGGHLMELLKQRVMQSPAFARYLNYVTSLGVPQGYKGQIRRFRPALDYTVAHYGILTQKAVLDATICFAAGNGGLPIKSDDDDDASPPAAASKQQDDDGDDLANLDEADVLWQSDDVGGFECYIEADDYESSFTRDGDGNNDDKDGAAMNDPAEEYNAADDTNLLSVSASNNTLSLVYRDPGTMRFIKYVGSRAPSSRWDISMEYKVPDDEEQEQKESS